MPSPGVPGVVILAVDVIKDVFVFKKLDALRVAITSSWHALLFCNRVASTRKKVLEPTSETVHSA